MGKKKSIWDITSCPSISKALGSERVDVVVLTRIASSQRNGGKSDRGHQQGEAQPKKKKWGESGFFICNENLGSGSPTMMTKDKVFAGQSYGKTGFVRKNRLVGGQMRLTKGSLRFLRWRGNCLKNRSLAEQQNQTKSGTKSTCRNKKDPGEKRMVFVLQLSKEVKSRRAQFS